MKPWKPDSLVSPPIADIVESHHLLLPNSAELGRLDIAKTFWRAILFCAVLNWAALNDGFQQQVPGNIIPLPAFVATMANTVIDGQPAISATVISFWQGFAEMSKTAGMFAGGTIADRFGRK